MTSRPTPAEMVHVRGPDDANNQRGPDLPKTREPSAPYVWVKPMEVPPEHRWKPPAFKSGMNPGWIYIKCLIDSSASMVGHRSRVVPVVNDFLAGRMTPPLDSQISVDFFNDIRWSRNDDTELRADLPPLAPLALEEYHPSGPTALLDALGWAIEAAWEGWIMLTDEERPARTVIAVYTDGGENASQKYCRQHIVDLMHYFTEEKGWEFVFLAARPEWELENPSAKSGGG